MKKTTRSLVDSAYQGIQKFHGNSQFPTKRRKNKPLSKAQKQENRRISSARVAIENIIREVKIFRIVAEKYRNRRRRFALRFNLIAAIYNLNLNYK